MQISIVSSNGNNLVIQKAGKGNRFILDKDSYLKSAETLLKDSSKFKNILNKSYAPKLMVPNVPKRNVFIKIPFLGSTSFQIRKKL